MEKFNLPANPRVLIFDIDMTLYTCPEYAHEQIDCQIRHWAQLKGYQVDSARAMIADFRRKWAAEHNGQKISLGNLFTSFGVSIETSIEWRKTLFNPADYLHRDEKLISALSELSKSFYMICVTNNPVEPARKTLEVIGISEFFPEIIGLDTCMASKPSKKILDAALQKANDYFENLGETGRKISYSDCISIGDRYDIDLALAIELGMGGILVSGSEEVCNLSDILL
ncbi:MAG: HAD family hydrolase [Treponema sp.]|uniref:HAD family hydrolase n=1 Tax=Treponema sp. TaxID=166 RepID=UPI001B57AA22|nr:HAD family hydrolase [Treponema sp.]MBP3772232.1 HAD family hydrolase [Treponema sp.]MBQ9281974.1 HAD family hydrolase [Treponema sp.]